jgi:hypothetical protein
LLDEDSGADTTCHRLFVRRGQQQALRVLCTQVYPKPRVTRHLQPHQVKCSSDPKPWVTRHLQPHQVPPQPPPHTATTHESSRGPQTAKWREEASTTSRACMQPGAARQRQNYSWIGNRCSLRTHAPRLGQVPRDIAPLTAPGRTTLALTRPRPHPPSPTFCLTSTAKRIPT